MRTLLKGKTLTGKCKSIKRVSGKGNTQDWLDLETFLIAVAGKSLRCSGGKNLYSLVFYRIYENAKSPSFDCFVKRFMETN